MATVRSQLGSFVLFYVAVPVLLMLGLILRLSYVNITTHNGDEVAAYSLQVCDRVGAEFYSLTSKVKASIDGQKFSALLADGEVDFSPENNEVSESFRSLIRKNPQILGLFVTDNRGDIVATSERTTRANSQTEDWWKAAKVTEEGAYVLNGVTELNTVFIAMPVSEGGVLRAQVSVETLVKRMPQVDQADDEGYVVISPNGSYKVGDSALMERVGRAIITRHAKTLEEKGWSDGGRFQVEKLKAPFEFPDAPLKVLAFKEEALIPKSQAKNLALIMFGCLAFAGIVIFRADRAGERLGEGTTEIVAAGSILLNQMNGDGTETTSSKGAVGRRIDSDFNRWLAGVKQGVLDNVETQNHEVERDQELAKEFQLAYLNRPYPAIPPRPTPSRLKLQFTHYYEPALALGGDFFEILTLSPDTAGIFIADVMGHGTRSALITSSLRSLLHDLIPQGRNARNLIAEINKNFYTLLQSIRLKNPLFASAFYFVADVTARAATYSTAGHPAPFHLHRATNTLKRLEVPSPHGAALGINIKEEYTGGGCRIADGDVFIFFTDGIYEAFNASGQEFGINALEKVIRGLMHSSVEDITKGIAAAVKDFTEGEVLQDDLCIVAVEVQEG